uniref:Uncharacterized protein n=1 Tax=Parascaris equorum TaxID=6256 RepID=A0A914RNA9_PAREQ
MVHACLAQVYGDVSSPNSSSLLTISRGPLDVCRGEVVAMRFGEKMGALDGERAYSKCRMSRSCARNARSEPAGGIRVQRFLVGGVVAFRSEALFLVTHAVLFGCLILFLTLLLSAVVSIAPLLILRPTA